MNTDDILAQIDTALGDTSVSLDAMRSRPTDVPDGERQQDGYTADYAWIDEAAATSQPEVWIAAAGADPRGEGWQRLEGVASVEFGEDMATVEITPDLERFTAAMRATQEAVAANLERTLASARQALQRFAEALHDSGEWVDTNGDPVQPPVRPSPPLPRRDGRPAWQSQYGPARRR